MQKGNDFLRLHYAHCPMRSSKYGRDPVDNRTAFETEKELNDRTLRLAEIGKLKSNWELQQILWIGALRKKKRKDSTSPVFLE